MSAPGATHVQPIGTFTDVTTLRAIDNYRNTLALRYFALDPAEISSRLRGEALVSAKFDGELWFLTIQEGTATLVAPNGRLILDSPVLDAAPTDIGQAIIAGELVTAVEGRRSRVSDVARALAGASEHPLEFIIFDVVSAEDVTALGTPYPQRWEWLVANLPNDGPLRIAPTVTATGSDEVSALFAEFVTRDGHEGVVVHTEDNRTYKVKPVIDFDAVIIGYTERPGDDGQVELRSILLGIEHPDGGMVPICSSGNLGTANQRSELFAMLQPLTADSDYRHSSASGVLYRFVRPQIVAEMRCHDIQADDSRGERVMATLLQAEGSGWHARGRVESASIIHPVLVRLRPDKSPTGPDVGWRHLEPYLPPVLTPTGSTRTPVEILRRQVWTKETAGRTDVRKLLIWRTNKEPAFGAFVVHWTDYSAARKDPLKREVRLAPTQDGAEQLAEEMVAANVKRGWELAESVGD